MILLLLAFSSFIFCQTNLYGILNAGFSNQKFVRIDLGSSTIDTLGIMPGSFISSAHNACLDAENNMYYLSSGNQVYKLNTLSGVCEDTIDYMAMYPYQLNNLVFNKFDGFIYALRKNPYDFADTIYFTQVNPLTKAMIDISALPFPVSFTMPLNSTIDLSRQHYIHQSDMIIAIDIPTGQVIYRHPINNSGSETFSHIAYSCTEDMIYGLKNYPNVPEEYLGTIDTSSGTVSLVNPAPLPTVFYKDDWGGGGIDDQGKVFYYPAIGSMIYGVDLTTGTLVYSHDFGTGFEFQFLEVAANYHCPIAGISHLDEIDFSIFPNPFISQVSISLPVQSGRLLLYDQFGRVMLDQLVNKNSQLDFSFLPMGIYLAEIKNGDMKYSTKLVKLSR